MTSSGPLSGIRLIEIDAIGPVPFASMLMADLGADIVRIARSAAAGPAAWDDVGGEVLYRSRKVARLNLKDPADREQLLMLVERADGLIEGFRPGVMERLGLGPDTCLSRNPRLVFGRMTGWGQNGPLAPRAGHDINYLSLTGALHALGEEGRPPCVPLNLVGDYGGGAMFLVTGMLAALLACRATGQGQVVDACITDGTATLMSLFYAWHASGQWIDRPANNLLDGAAPFYRCYTCADGRHVAVGCLEPQFFGHMIAGLGLTDRDYRQNDRDGWPAMQADFEETFATRARDEWADHFRDTDACVTPVLSMEEAPHHPHNAARGAFAVGGDYPAPAPAPRFSGSLPTIGPARAVDIAAVIEEWKR